MFNYKKIIVFFSALAVLLIVLTGFSFAAQRSFEVLYPTVPGAEFPAKKALPDYIKYIFNFSIWVAGFIAFGALIYGGVKYLTSVGSPSSQKDARDQILAGMFGLGLLLGSILLLNTINPKIVVSNPIKTTPWGGVDLFPQPNCGGGGVMVSISSPNLQNDIGFTAHSMRFKDKTKDVLNVVIYSKNDYEPFDGGSPYSSDGGASCINFNPPPLGGSSFANSIDLFWKLPGVILVDYDAGGKEVLIDQTMLALGDFNNKADEVKFNNLSGLDFGVVLHNFENQQGECSVILKNTPDLNSNYVIQRNRTGSATVFLKGTRGEPGSGVTLYKDKSQANLIYGPITSHFLDSNPARPCMPIPMVNNDQTRSIRVDKGYMAVLFDNIDCTGVCQVFFESNPNLENDLIGQCGCGPFGWGCHPCTSAIIVLPVR